jgi:hypothetical protein
MKNNNNKNKEKKKKKERKEKKRKEKKRKKEKKKEKKESKERERKKKKKHESSGLKTSMNKYYKNVVPAQDPGLLPSKAIPRSPSHTPTRHSCIYPLWWNNARYSVLPEHNTVAKN